MGWVCIGWRVCGRVLRRLGRPVHATSTNVWAYDDSRPKGEKSDNERTLCVMKLYVQKPPISCRELSYRKSYEVFSVSPTLCLVDEPKFI